jgi:multicomponent K+:H+ antiporter subunit D
MSGASSHLVILPVLVPLAAGALLLLLDERRQGLKAAISLATVATLLGLAIALVRLADRTPSEVYQLGDWPAPYGIVLVADRLSALMLLLAAVLACAALTFSLARWHRAGARFHSLFMLLLAGVDGAFLTEDLFNLFVFFELLLVASYGLALHGSGAVRVRASLHYIAVNLAASLLFLAGVGLIHGVTGTLNMADLAAAIPAVRADDRVLVEAGAALLGTAFLVKAGMWPLCFWLPGTYAAASAPVAALFSILSKVGIYALLRLWLLLFGAQAGASTHFGADWLLVGGMLTLAFGIVGVLASQELPRIAGFSLIVSSGTLLAALGADQASVTGAAIFYLVVSTLAVSALYMLAELLERSRAPGADVLAVTREAFGEVLEEEEETGVAIPAAMAILGLSFLACALLIAGLPPLAGFIAKFALLAALLGAAGTTTPPSAWLMLGLLMLSGLAVVIAMTRTGMRIFWSSDEGNVPRVRVVEMAPVAALLFLCAGLTVQAGPAMRYMQAAAQSLHAPATYINGVLSR